MSGRRRRPKSARSMEGEAVTSTTRSADHKQLTFDGPTESRHKPTATISSERPTSLSPRPVKQMGRTSVQRSFYDMLGVAEDSSRETLVAAHARAAALLDGTRPGGFLMMTASALSRAELDDALAQLLDDKRRRAHDAALRQRRQRTADGNATEHIEVDDAQIEDDSHVQRDTDVHKIESSHKSLPPVDEADEPPPVHTSSFRILAPIEELDSDDGPTDANLPAHTSLLPQNASLLPIPALDGGIVDGGTIRGLRESRGITLEQLSDATKVRKMYLAAIESEDIENLPARVYLRGFLTQVARVLRVDRNVLAEGYLQHLSQHAGFR